MTASRLRDLALTLADILGPLIIFAIVAVAWVCMA